MVPDRNYGRLVVLPPIDGEPALTITVPEVPARRAPDPAYVAVIAAGLHELGLTVEEAADYLDAASSGG